MSFFKKIKDKAKMVIGAVAVATLGACVYWKMEKIGYESNVTTFNWNLNNAIFIGDTGQPGPLRNRVYKAIIERGSEFLEILGDQSYPVGTTSMEYFERDITPLLGPWRTVLIGSNHQAYEIKQNKRDWLFENADRLGVEFRNYYRGEVYPNICLGYMDSSVYDVKIGSPRMLPRQEKFIQWFFSRSDCEGKIRAITLHHTIYTYGPHMKDGDQDLKDFIVSLPVDFIISGHDHLTALTIVGGKNYFVVGAGSKLSECKARPKDGYCKSAPAYLEFSDNKFFVRLIP